MHDPHGRAAQPQAPALGLDQRIAALESGCECGEDFDFTSLCWLLVLGVLLPVALLFIGWRLR